MLCLSQLISHYDSAWHAHLTMPTTSEFSQHVLQRFVFPDLPPSLTHILELLDELLEKSDPQTGLLARDYAHESHAQGTCGRWAFAASASF